MRVATATSTHHRTCPFCEATCGLEVTVSGRDVVAVRGDAEDVFSKGFLCPKATGLEHLHADPDRLAHAARQAGGRHVRRSRLGRGAGDR